MKETVSESLAKFQRQEVIEDFVQFDSGSFTP